MRETPDPLHRAAVAVARTLAKRGFLLLQEASLIEIAVRHASIAGQGTEKDQAVAKLENVIAKHKET